MKGDFKFTYNSEKWIIRFLGFPGKIKSEIIKKCEEKLKKKHYAGGFMYIEGYNLTETVIGHTLLLRYNGDGS